METRRVKQPRLAATKKAVPQGHRFFGLSSGLLAFGLLIDVVGEEQVLQDWAALLLG